MARPNEEDVYEDDKPRRKQGKPAPEGQRRRRPANASSDGRQQTQRKRRRAPRPDSDADAGASQHSSNRRRRPASADGRRRPSGSGHADGSTPNRRRSGQRPSRRPAGNDARRPANGNPRRRPSGTRPSASRPAGSPRAAVAGLSPQILIAGGVGVLLIVILVFAIARCTAKPSENSQQAEQQQQAAGTASTSEAQSNNSSSSGSGSSASSGSTTVSEDDVKVPDPAWKKAAGVPDLTKQGTDPTKIAATMQAEREAANLADGYKGVESPWIDGGYFTSGDKDLDKQVKEFCDKHSSKDKSVDENAYNTFCNITWSDYNEWEGNQYPRTYDWTVDYAKDFFSKGGNCFSMASAIQWCLRYFGYTDAHAELTYQERQSGLWLDHGLTWVTDKKSGEIKMVDSEMAANGWMMKPSSYSVEILDPTSNWEPRSSAFDVARN